MMCASLAEEVGLGFRSTFARGRQFFLAIAAAPLVLALMTWLLPLQSSANAMSIPVWLSLVLLQPLVEELLFRGVIQGQLEKASWTRHRLAGLSVANFFTTLLFALAHLIHHAPLWAAGVIIPSLVFGHFRDRHRQVFPAFLLHAFYNGCYLSAGMVSAFL